MKRAIVIGATSGIGKGLAGLLAVNDYKLGITGRRTDLLQALGVYCFCFEADAKVSF